MERRTDILHMQRQTDINNRKDRWTEGLTTKQKYDRLTNRWTNTHTDRWTNRWTDKNNYNWTDGHSVKEHKEREGKKTFLKRLKETHGREKEKDRHRKE